MNGEHEWIKIEITPVHVIANGASDPIVFVDPDEQQIASEFPQYGCSLCDVYLDSTSVETICPGRSEEELQDETLPMMVLDEYHPWGKPDEKP